MHETMQPATSNDGAGHMADLVSGIARLLVDLPDQVVIEAISTQDETILRLHVAHGDVGKIIGKQGRTARSLRTIISAASMKLKHRFSLDIVEEDKGLETA